MTASSLSILPWPPISLAALASTDTLTVQNSWRTWFPPGLNIEGSDNRLGFLNSGDTRQLEIRKLAQPSTGHGQAIRHSPISSILQTIEFHSSKVIGLLAVFSQTQTFL